MDFSDYLSVLEKDGVFATWKKDHADAYLVHFFFMEGMPVQVGYYDKASDKVGSFVVEPEGSPHVSLAAEEEAFKKEKEIPALDFSAVKISLDQALEVAKDLQQKKYSSDPPTKTIVLLQVIDNKPVYNITYVTLSFKMLNIRVHAVTGDVVSDKIEPLMNLGTMMKGGKTNES